MRPKERAQPNTVRIMFTSQTAETVPISPDVLYFGTPVAILSTLNPDGTTNLAAMSSFWALEDRIVLGLARNGQSGANLIRESDCVLNLPSPREWEGVERLGRTTGATDIPDYKLRAGFVHAADKFAASGFTPKPSELVGPQRIAECPVQIEAEVLARHAGSDKKGAGLLIVELRKLAVHGRPEILIADRSRIDVDSWSPLFYIFRHYFGKGARMGRSFRARY